MPCLLVVIALAAPRLVVALLWFFTSWFAGLFASPLWPLAGFIFLPTTLLWYSAVLRFCGGSTGNGLFGPSWASSSHLRLTCRRLGAVVGARISEYLWVPVARLSFSGCISPAGCLSRSCYPTTQPGVVADRSRLQEGYRSMGLCRSNFQGARKRAGS